MAIQQTTNIPEVQDTIVMIRQLSADEKVQQEAYYREKQIRDEISALNGARSEGRLDVLTDLVKKGIITITQAAEQEKMPVEEFSKLTGLPVQ